MRNNKWEKFAKLAAAIRMAERRGATVKWNSRIVGQRFDATLSFNDGNRDYLIVVDCIDDNAPVTAARVKSFARKVDVARAHMGLMVSSSEYLQEAFELTADHSVMAIDWQTMNEASEQKLADIFRPARLVYNFRFMVTGSAEEIAIPEEPPVLRFFMREIKIKGPGIDTCPEQLIKDADSAVSQSAVGRPQRHEVALPHGTVIIHPNTNHQVPVRAFAFTYRLIPEAELLSPEVHHAQDPYGAEASLRQELAKRNPLADPNKVESGFDTILRPKRYYYNPQLQFSYYCEEVKKGQATIVLVESYQNGNLFQGRAVISRALYYQFVEVTEQSELERLTKLYDKFSVSDKNLEGRFKVFLNELEGAECIDDLALTPKQQRAKKADYFLASRTIVSELKALYTDTSAKIEAILAPYRERPEWPILIGKHDLQRVLRHLPDRDQINAKIIEAVTDSIEAVVESANRQIRTTKETFGLPDTGGLLIILNDAVDILSPDLVIYRVRRALNKRTSEGEPRFPHVSAVLLIGGAHYTQMTPTLKSLPVLLIPNVLSAAAKVEEYVLILNEQWAAFEGQPLIHMEPEMLPSLTFRKFSDDAKRPAGPLTRQDYWSAMYQRNPYLRSLSEEQVLDSGQRAFEEFSMRLIKGAPKTPREEMEQLLIRWSDFLDEAKHRGLDMRKLISKSDGLNEKLEELYQRYQGESQN